MNTAQQILDQIKVLDPFLLIDIGAKDFVSSKANGKHKGWLQFKVSNCMKVSNGTNVRITLEYDDTYTVKTFSMRKIRNTMDYSFKDIEELKDTQVANLVEAINKVVG